MTFLPQFVDVHYLAVTGKLFFLGIQFVLLIPLGVLIVFAAERLASAFKRSKWIEQRRSTGASRRSSRRSRRPFLRRRRGTDVSRGRVSELENRFALFLEALRMNDSHAFHAGNFADVMKHLASSPGWSST